MKTIPYKHQLQDVQVMHRHGGRTLNCNEMGTGKSLTSLMFAERHPDCFPIVIVCPAVAKYNWERECKIHMGWRAEVLTTTKPPKRRLLDKNHRIVVVNYEVLIKAKGRGHRGPGWLKYLKRLRPQMIVIDEAHRVGNPYAKQSRAVRALCKGAKYVHVLSGTIASRHMQLWHPLHLLHPDKFPSYRAFLWRYTNPKQNRYGGWDFRESDNHERLHRVLKKIGMIRRRKEDVLKNLPPLRRVTQPVEIVKRKSYQQALTDFVGWLVENFGEVRARRTIRVAQLAHIGYLKRLIAELKLPSVFAWIDSFLEGSDDKLIVFATHKKIVKALRERYHGQCVVVDGSVTGRKRKLAVDEFQHRPQCRVFIGNLKAAGEAITLTASATSLTIELAWKPDDHTQAESRNHRIGQTKSVTAYYLVGRDTIEEKLVKRLQELQKTPNRTIDGGAKSADPFAIYDAMCKELLKERKRR